MKHIDYLQFALVANLIAIFVAMVTAGVLAWNNSGSKNMPLAVAALIGVMVGYLIQLPFELAPSKSFETIGVQFTIDRAQPVIRQWVYGNNAQLGWRLIAEVEASNWLTKNYPAAFEQQAQRDKIALHLTMYSLVSYLSLVEYDWQLQRKSYGSMELSQSVSKPEECSTYIESDLKQQLKKAGNLFAGAPIRVLLGKLCLPPKTDLEISADTLTLRNPFCQMVFRAEHPAHSILNVHPKTRTYVDLGNGVPRYEIRQMGLNIETTFFALRAQHRNSKQYRDWVFRVVDGARGWFAPGDPLGEPQQVQPAPR